MPVPWQALLLLTLMAVAAVAGSAYHLIRERRLTRDGVRTQAVVVDLRDLPTRGGRTSTSPVVEFTTLDGRRVRAQSQVGSSPPTVMPGRQLTVYYDPNDPERVALEGYGQTAYWVFLGIGILLFGLVAALAFGTPEMFATAVPVLAPLLLGGTFLGVGGHGVGRVWLLRAKGGQAEGVVVGESMTRTREGMPLHHPVVRFRLPTGHEIEATSERGRSVRRVRPGQSVRVRYHPDNPTRMVLAGDGALPMFYVFGTIGLVVLAGTAYVGLTFLFR